MKKILLLLIVFAYATSLKAQNNNSLNFNLNHIALSVKDLNRSVDFYTKVLQLKEITKRTSLDGIRWLSIADGREIHLISILKDPVIINKAVHFALDTKNMDAFIRQLDDMKIPYSDWPGNANTVTKRADGIKQLYLQDPDGYWIEINDEQVGTAVDQIKNDVWKLEENYWKYVKEKDLKSYINLWDEHFIGYPSTNLISNKAKISDWITEMYKGKTVVFNYELNRKVENVFGDIVFVFYDVTHSLTNEKNETTKQATYKITHTWKKTGNEWLIIGGMGAIK